MYTYILSLGSNLGDKHDFLTTSIEKLKTFGTIHAISSFYETEPWGYCDQPLFVNAVVVMQSMLAPLYFLHACQYIECELGRTRTIRYGPRTIDIDILFCDDLIFSSDRLIIPHPRMHERLFVLDPLCDVFPSFVHPVYNVSCSFLKNSISS